MIVTITLETDELIETGDLSLLEIVKNGDGFTEKLNSEEFFTIIDIYGEKVIKKWNLIESINIKF